MLKEQDWITSDNKKDGYWIYYSPDGKISAKGNYKNNLKADFGEEYTNNERIEGSYLNGKKNSYWICYNVDEQVA